MAPDLKLGFVKAHGKCHCTSRRGVLFGSVSVSCSILTVPFPSVFCLCSRSKTVLLTFRATRNSYVGYYGLPPRCMRHCTEGRPGFFFFSSFLSWWFSGWVPFARPLHASRQLVLAEMCGGFPKPRGVPRAARRTSK